MLRSCKNGGRPRWPCLLMLSAAILVAGGSAPAAHPEGVAATLYAYVQAADIRSDNWTDANDGMWFDVDQGYVTSNLVESGCMSGPATLPNGSTIIAFTPWLWDSDSGADFTVRLKRRASTGSGADEIASVTTLGSQSAIVAYPDFSVSNATVDNDGFTYFVEMCTSSNKDLHRFYGAQVAYTP